MFAINPVMLSPSHEIPVASIAVSPPKLGIMVSPTKMPYATATKNNEYPTA